MSDRSNALTLEVQPPQPLVDEHLSIRLSGLPPGQHVTLRAEVGASVGHRWVSVATFATDRNGRVDPSVQAPISGRYTGVDAMGLFWSMVLDPLQGSDPPFPLESLDPLPTRLTAELDGHSVATARFERLLLAPGVTRMPVRDEGLVATLFVPPTAPAPGVMVLGGSGGGLAESKAALLAAHGFTTLAVAYFNAEHLPPELRAIPLEYFETAITWLLRQESVKGSVLGVLGGSRGGELALLLGATYPQIGAVVGTVPSGVMHGAIARDPATVNSPAWVHRGQPLPFLPRDESLNERWGEGPIPLTPMYLAALRDDDAVQRATIPVERTNGPVLLISGEDDQMWPSPTLAEIAMERLKQHRHPYPNEHIAYPAAGHVMPAPYLPSRGTQGFHPVRRKTYAYGGTPAGNAVAGADSWRRVLAFFRTHLRDDLTVRLPHAHATIEE